MSEASESVHFWRAAHAEVRQCTLSVGVIGRIVASNERWTSFVPFEDDEAMKVALAARGVSLLWRYFGDFGLRLTFIEAGKQLGRVDFGWQDGPTGQVPPHLAKQLREKGVLDSFEPLQELAQQVTAGACSPRTLRDRAAALLGLAAYEWLSPRYARDTSVEEIKQQFPEAEDITDE